MSFYVLKRCVQAILSIAVMVVAVFFLARLTGNPADLYLPVDTIDSVRDEFAALHGFDRSFPAQFVSFVSGLAQGDFGMSLRLQVPALEAAGDALPTTLMLSAIVVPLALLLAVGIGVAAALRPHGLFDGLASALSLAAASVPEFWLAIVGILFFAVTMNWLPSSGTGTPWHWVLPVIVLTLRPLGVLTQVTRASLLAALSAPYVKTALAKGAGSGRILLVHCARNTMPPILNVASDQAVNLISGAAIVEIIFGLPGIGRLVLEAIVYRDFALLQALVILVAVAVFMLTALTDIVHALLDPRVKNV